MLYAFIMPGASFEGSGLLRFDCFNFYFRFVVGPLEAVKLLHQLIYLEKELLNY